ncbi:hypothetical protein PFJ87_05g01980 [Encephalitozoon hellem]|uniref:Uncharacterized protein n=1 Tax=Encephalitozoon hellem TaxID=27973 RepID=A0ABY8CP22_ENCHE|nr:hypothetical protein PFJ87_01g02130 [Encephalitozoon hellem]WEL37976.1 hypothetical protein PFJ87_02g00120 [Encephalitozoon hellem]WEL38727.1 hypothetical protein PFJ87_05g01980 [Encephalitozoon hellem]
MAIAVRIHSNTRKSRSVSTHPVVAYPKLVDVRLREWTVCTGTIRLEEKEL